MVVVIAAGAFVVTSNGSHATPSPSHQVVVIPTLPSRPEATPSPEATDEATSAPVRTPEPAPLTAWKRFQAPDKTWSVSFPDTMTPLKQSQSVPGGAIQGDMVLYAVEDGGAGYAVAFANLAVSVPGGSDFASIMKIMEPSMASQLGGTVVSSSDSMLGGQPARDMEVASTLYTYNIRLGVVGKRFYLLMTFSTTGVDVFPNYFMESFTVK
jgi:hypothetical protein